MDTRILRWLAVACICFTVVTFRAIGTAGTTKSGSGPSVRIIHTTATLDQVLTGYDKMRVANRWRTAVEDGKITEYGLQGTYHDVVADENFSETVDLGILSYKFGSLNGQRWEQNSNGIVMRQHNTHQEDEIANETLVQHARRNNEGLTLIGETAPPLSAYVIEVHAAGGRHEWQFYDKQSFQLVRSEKAYQTKRVIVTYDDFRTVDGVTSSWHDHRTDGHPQNDADFVTIRERFNLPVASTELDIPHSRADLVQFPAGAQVVRLPARIIDGDIVIRVMVGERGCDFLLDSGASSIVMDAGLAKSLGLPTLGESVQSAGGSFEQKQALIPEMRVGAITLRNVVVDTTSFSEQKPGHTKVVGLLGFDFIANAGLKIDYQRGTVEAMPPDVFVPPADAHTIDALWDDGVPRIPVQLGDAVGHFIFDTGAFGGLIYQRFAQAHPDAVRDEQGGQMEEYTRGLGVGGTFSMQPTHVRVLSVGGIEFHNVLMYEVVSDPGFEYEDYDGLLGSQFLKSFTVYIDYKDSRIYLVGTPPK